MTKKKLKKKNNPHRFGEELRIEKEKIEKKEEIKESEKEKLEKFIKKYIEKYVITPVTEIEILFLFLKNLELTDTSNNISERIIPPVSKDYKPTITQEALEKLVEKEIVKKTGEGPNAFYSLKSEEMANFIIKTIRKEEIEGLGEERKENIKRGFLIPWIRLEILKLFFIDDPYLMKTAKDIAGMITRDETITKKIEIEEIKKEIPVEVLIVEKVLEELAGIGIIKKIGEGKEAKYSLYDDEEKKELMGKLIIQYMREKEKRRLFLK